MDGCGFYDSVVAHPDLEMDGVVEGMILVEHGPTKALYALAPESVAAEEWETLEAILCGKRKPTILSHMSRVVGYYSQVENWNKSKLGELAARRRGDYSIAYPAAAPVAVAGAAAAG